MIPKSAQNARAMHLRILLLAAILGSCAPPPPPGPPLQPGELVGRIAGKPVDCLPISPSAGMHFADDDRSTLIYGSGRTVWANRLGPGCSFSSGDIPVFEPMVSSYCRGDIVKSVDRYSRIPGPSCVLGPFVPYTRP